MTLARQLDPLSAIINSDEGAFLYLAGQTGEARHRFQKAIELAPDLGDPHEGLALIDLEEDRKSDALQEARAGLALDATSPGIMADAGYVLAVTGHKEEARKLAGALDDLNRRGATVATNTHTQTATVYHHGQNGGWLGNPVEGEHDSGLKLNTIPL
jgi:Flp pilus assembly protein TadD